MTHKKNKRNVRQLAAKDLKGQDLSKFPNVISQLVKDLKEYKYE